MIAIIIHYDSNLKKMITDIINDVRKINIEEVHDKPLIHSDFQFTSTFILELEESSELVDTYSDVIQYTIYDNGQKLTEIQADYKKYEGEIHV